MERFRNFFQSYFHTLGKHFHPREWIGLSVFLLISISINYLLCETIYFIPLHSADQLYTPLIVSDFVKGEGILHWYLPPSPYFFPDILLMFILYIGFPFLVLPTMYGVIQMGLVSLGLYLLLSSILSKQKSLSFLIWFQTIFTLFSLLGDILGDKPLPLVYFFSNAHHSTGFFFSLFLVSLYYKYQSNPKPSWNQAENRNHNQTQNLRIHAVLYPFLFFIGFSLLYLSDRFAFCIGIICFLVIHSLEGNQKQWKEISYPKCFYSIGVPIVSLVVLELTFYFLKSKFHIPNSFGILFTTFQTKTWEEISFLSVHYLFDFAKQFLYHNRSLLGLCFVLGLTYPKFPFRLKRILIVLFPILLVLLVVVGRFTYLHPYPIRYLFPIWFLGILGISWVMSNEMKPFPILVLLLTLTLWILFLSFLPKPRNSVKKTHQSIRNEEVPYDLEKPIRFWTEGKQKPIPIEEGGKPYRWITGAFHTP
ncbi:hypothetical protein [Leptospira kemamanensis]|uniref:hypothetical protein n=1 Tax=Leptospira kemamanensis TaxID=2484942 RepID=UPI001FC9B520|nr:hypothetical protein [Leptospira kemamanensis]